MTQKDKIYIAGHNGMVGSSLERKLRAEGFNNIVTKNSNELDLRNQQSVNDFFESEKPSYVLLAAARVGGIFANNKYRAEFIYDNLMIETNIIHASYKNNVKKLLNLGSSCVYPKNCPQPIKEEYLLSGFLEYTNRPYAIAKIAGIELCQSYNNQYNCNYISVMPTNLYGTNDNYHPENSHVLPALLRRIHLAKMNNDNEVVIWGTGNPFREFMHVDDLSDACIFLLNNYNENELINVGWGKDISIFELSQLIKTIVGYKGNLLFDNTKPDGTPKKLLDTSKINKLGWFPKIRLEDGIRKTYSEIINMF
jgi:GDP-L-fucose synthase